MLVDVLLSCRCLVLCRVGMLDFAVWKLLGMVGRCLLLRLAVHFGLVAGTDCVMIVISVARDIPAARVSTSCSC